MSLRFAGYAAIFDRIDRGGDVIRAGAFGKLPKAVPLLWQHKGAPVGVIERIGEDKIGLRVTGRITSPGLAALVQSGAVRGLSFGYRTLASRQAARGTYRELTAVSLIEVSLVATPMQALARVHAVEGTQDGAGHE